MRRGSATTRGPDRPISSAPSKPRRSSISRATARRSPTFGVRDTFPFEERTILAASLRALEADRLDDIRGILDRHRGSVWIGKGESQAQWGLVEAALRLVECCDDADRQLADHARGLDALIGYYVSSLCEVDRRQREFEQSIGDLVSPDAAMMRGHRSCTAALRAADREDQHAVHAASGSDRMAAARPARQCRRVQPLRPAASERERAARRLFPGRCPALRAGRRPAHRVGRDRPGRAAGGLCTVPDRDTRRHGEPAARRRQQPSAGKGGRRVRGRAGRRPARPGGAANGVAARPLRRPLRRDAARPVRRAKGEGAGDGRPPGAALQRDRQPFGEQPGNDAER